MINWTELNGLHVISKLEEIINKWFGVEVFYADNHFKIRSGHKDKDYDFKNLFFQTQMSLPHGYDFITADVERFSDELSQSGETVMIFDSYFPGVKMMGTRIEIEGEYQGTVFAFPFLKSTFS